MLVSGGFGIDLIRRINDLPGRRKKKALTRYELGLYEVGVTGFEPATF